MGAGREQAVERLLATAQRMSDGDRSALAGAWKDADARAFWLAIGRAEAAVRRAARTAEWSRMLTAARRAAPDGSPCEAGYAVEAAGVALIARDMIASDDFATLTRPWRAVEGNQ